MSTATAPAAPRTDDTPERQATLVNQWNERFTYSGTAVRVSPDGYPSYTTTVKGRAFLQEGRGYIKVEGGDIYLLNQVRPI